MAFFSLFLKNFLVRGFFFDNTREEWNPVEMRETGEFYFSTFSMRVQTTKMRESV